MGEQVTTTHRWAVDAQATAGPQALGDMRSGAPAPVVSGEAPIEGVAAGGGVTVLVPGRGPVDGEQFGLR